MGEVAGLAAAFVWASNNLVLRTQAARLGVLLVNAWRAFFAALCFAVIFLLTRDLGALTSIRPGPLAALLSSVVIGMAIGDSLQLTAMTRIGVARAMPIGACFPLFTVAIAAIFLREPITPRTVLGAVLVIGGVVLLALPQTADERAGVGLAEPAHRPPGNHHWVGVGMALAAALCWSLSTTLTRVALQDIDIITANTIRLPFSAAVSLLFSLGRTKLTPRQIGRRSFAILLLAGVVGTAGGGFLYLTSVSLAGAAKTAILASSAPVFGLLGAILFLHERPGLRGLLGTLVALAGLVLVI